MDRYLSVRIFVDFWNNQIEFNKLTGRNVRLDWKKFPVILFNQIKSIVPGDLRYDGTHVYISYDPKTPSGVNLRRWANNILDHFTGVSVTAKERRPKAPPHCPNCHKDIKECPHCSEELVRTIEKGIDTAIVTDMIKLAWEDAWDVAILCTSDRDYIPMVEFLASKGKRVINARYGTQGMHLARTSWANFDISQYVGDFTYTK